MATLAGPEPAIPRNWKLTDGIWYGFMKAGILADPPPPPPPVRCMVEEFAVANFQQYLI
jgi:hypothetical protein